ncbi:glutamyl-tRNA reductase [Aquipseudomonas ullengensis]|uniref:Glutamyl-tRNA reductase n=1 Tax=Aquipseudomonas ullengensis TaxID=2759166 RepID=A0A7W4Q976_9GAMM|nr:glutamyl-tRNA reductase [Pseudomonas ullengensis]MBB2494507.1 glutamyl-tRNA reductase [Pseudomonas ullengensis]
MAFLALGINHKTASVDVRERVAFTPEQLVEALQLLCRSTPSREAAILSTCNRSELYLEQDELAADDVLRWLADYHRLNIDDLRACAYVHQDDSAVRHMMRVASGLDSMVLGEPQILGQMKSAYAVAREAGTVGPLLGRLFQATFSTAKTVRTDTAIGENPVSVAFAAVSLAKQIFSDLHRSQALLIGAGETISLVARHLHDQGVKRIVVANRTLERASQLAEQFGAHAVLLADIPQELVNSDIVISSTASQLPILGKGAVERALKQRKHKPIFMVDIAVPRDIEPEVGELDDVYLYTVDDLHEVIAENLKSRQGAAQAAEELVSAGADDFMQRLRALAAVDVLKAYRQQAERLRDEELARAQRMLANGTSADEVLALLARGLTNKLLHAPSVQLKKISADGRYDALAVAQELFALDEGESKP